MSLLWRTAAAQPYEWSHETSPRESEEDVDLDEVEPRLMSSDLDYHHRKALEDSIRQHGVRSKHGFHVDSEEDLGHPEEDDDEDYWGEDHEHGDW